MSFPLNVFNRLKPRPQPQKTQVQVMLSGKVKPCWLWSISSV